MINNRENQNIIKQDRLQIKMKLTLNLSLLCVNCFIE